MPYVLSMTDAHPMTAPDFADWMAKHGLSLTTAGHALGLSRSAVKGYKVGYIAIPRKIALACYAIDQGALDLPAFATTETR